MIASKLGVATLESLAKWIPSLNSYIGGDYKQKLLFVPDADNKPEEDHEISEPALFRFLLNEETTEEIKRAEADIPDMLNVLKDVDKQSKITEFETHQSSMDLWKDLKGAFHVFIVFKTTSKKGDGVHWWSLEKGLDFITLQRSRNKNNVKDQCYGEPRNQVKPIVENLDGKGTIQDLFAVLWAQQVIPEKYNILNSNCQSFVTCISQQITGIGYEYQGYFPYSPPPESGREKKMLDLINILRGVPEWPVLFTLIQMENIDLLDKIVVSGKYDINAFYKGLTPLNIAIMCSKTQMIQHLLKPSMNADPTKRDEFGMNAFHWAAMFTMKAEIFDLLLAHDKVNIDDVDEDGQTALHWAASLSNVTAVKKLLENGANPNIVDNEGRSPLHAAARQRDGIPVIDLLLEAQKVKGLGDVNDRDERGWSALLYATSSSNEITAEHLIKKGADVNCRTNVGDTPLHAAAMLAKDMNIIDLLLENINEGDSMSLYNNDGKLFYFANLNMHGLGEEIVDQFLKKGIIKPRSRPTGIDEWTEGSDDEATGINARRFEEEGVDPLIDFIKHKGLQFSIGKVKNSQEIDEILTNGNFDVNGRDPNGETLLYVAVRANMVDWVRRLLERGADPTIRDNKGETPFHIAADRDKDPGILHLLLENGKVDINETTSKHGATALHYAIVTSNVDAARFLLSKGANPNVTDGNGLTPLHYAAMFAKDLDIIDLLLNHPDVDVKSALYYASINKTEHGERIVNRLKEKGAVNTEKDLPKINTEFFKKHMRDFNNQKLDEIEKCVSDDTIPIGDKIARISERDEYLYSAIKDSNAANVRILLKSGAGTRTKGEMEMNALHLTSLLAKTTDVLDVILETEKFDINGVDNRGWTPLHYAIWGNNFEIKIRHLILKGADPNIADEEGNTPLHLAVSNAEKIKEINLKLEQLDINHRDKGGMTAPQSAITFKPVEIARCLMENGTDPTMRNQHGNTPFHLAALYLADTDVLGLMLANKKEIDIDVRDKSGFTALHLAIVSYNMTAVRFLLSNGADPNAVNKNGNTPLHAMVVIAKDMDMVELLVNQQNTNVNYLDNNGINALRYAKYNQHGLGEAIANLLRAKMAAKAEGSNHEPENMAVLVPGRIRGDLDMETIRFLIEKGQDISAMTGGEDETNAFHSTSRYVDVTELIDFLQKTNLCGTTTAVKCTLDDNENMVKEVLTEAIRHSDAEKVRNLIEMGADLGKTTWGVGMNALHAASIGVKTTEILDVILATGEFDINGRDEDGETALHFAMSANNMTTARYLLGKGADPTISDENGLAPFHLAAQFLTDTDVLDLMLIMEKKINIDEKDKKGRTALHMAIMKSNGIAVRFLLSNGANPNVADGKGLTPLHWAAGLAKDLEIVELLLHHKDTNVNFLDNKGNNALYCATFNAHGLGEAIGNLLREKMAAKAEGNNHEPENMAALVPASGIKEDSDMETIRFLIESGMDISAMTWGGNGANALHLAAAKNEETTDLIDAILETGKFDINGVDIDGRTPLHYAIKRPDPVTINARRLIKMGADPGIADKNGVTPLHMAARNAESMDLIEVLLNTEAVDVNCVDKQGRTPLVCARNNKHGLGQRIVDRLKEFDEME